MEGCKEAEMLRSKDILWLDVPYRAGPVLCGDQEVDVAIVGGGFTGLASAYFIKRRFPNKRIILLEAEFIGFGSSGRNSGGVAGNMGHNYSNLKKKFGTEKMMRLQHLMKQCVGLVEQLIQDHKIECDYERTGRLVVAETDRQAKRLEAELRDCQQAGAKVEWFDRIKARQQFGCLDLKAAIRYPDEGIIDPVKFLRGMKGVVESLGVDVYEHSRCLRMIPGSPASSLIKLFTSGGSAVAKEAVLATNAYSDPLRLFRYKVLPFYIYTIVTEPLSQSQRDGFQFTGRGNVFGATNLYWARNLTADNRLNFIECDVFYYYNHEKDYSCRPKSFRREYDLMVRKFPFLKGIRVTHAWGGLIGVTLDFLPFIGRTGRHGNIYFSAGYNGCGLAPSQLAGKIIAALMAGEKSDLTDNVLIGRKPFYIPSAAVTYLGLKAYRSLFKLNDWFLGGQG
ncbi:MAG: FAD-binding oxidoreductase [Deltaproteobacteria bacterium]|nr:FAD-binding oxidoreductase [Deltaproteobacteria bacterium]